MMPFMAFRCCLSAVASWRLAIIASFAAVAVDLKKRDAKHRLQDVVVSLAEDNQTVTVFANWSDDAATVCSSFMLPEPWPRNLLTPTTIAICLRVIESFPYSTTSRAMNSVCDWLTTSPMM